MSAHPEPAVDLRYRKITVLVGAQNLGAGCVERPDRALRGMPIVVAGAGRDQRDRGPHRGQEPGVLVRRSVVRHLQHVGPQVRAGGPDRSLRRWLDVPGEQDPDTTHPGQQHHAGVVRPGALLRGTANCVRIGAAQPGRWPEDVQPERPDR